MMRPPAAGGSTLPRRSVTRRKDRLFPVPLAALIVFAALGCAPAWVPHHAAAADVKPLAIQIQNVDALQRVSLEATKTSSGALSVTAAFGFDLLSPGDRSGRWHACTFTRVGVDT